ncbi:MAG: DeoR/GlpR transcriptional regulator [Solirubrobacterales bacterium]|nr:DeoR/GlpR transcriptional regulator [Solirubrobacterales bacterium]MBV9534031.1 DeoR/GlpR transcriptional regulator [Solirubrobacterales bacterium]
MAEMKGSSQDGATRYARPRHRVERLRAILNLTDPESTTAVDELASALSVSSATVRRDLAQLASQGLVLRSHGGAVRVDRGYELPIRYRETSQAAEKRRIGQAAAALVEDGAVVGFTGGTTTMEVSRALATRRDLTVVTNALNIGAELALRPNIRLVVTGGMARSASFELSGPAAERTIQDYNIDLAFIGVDGVDSNSGCTTHNDSEALTNAALVRRAARVVVVADHTKLGQVKFVKICDIDAVDLIVTDSGASEAQLAPFGAAHIEVKLA